MFGTAVELAGAFTIGSVIHRSVVRNEYALTAPPSVFGILLGLALIVAGRSLARRFQPSDYVPDTPDEEEEEGEEMEFDEELSPVPSDRLENREVDDSVDRE